MLRDIADSVPEWRLAQARIRVTLFGLEGASDEDVFLVGGPAAAERLIAEHAKKMRERSKAELRKHGNINGPYWRYDQLKPEEQALQDELLRELEQEKAR